MKAVTQIWFISVLENLVYTLFLVLKSCRHMYKESGVMDAYITINQNQQILVVWQARRRETRRLVWTLDKERPEINLENKMLMHQKSRTSRKTSLETRSIRRRHWMYTVTNSHRSEVDVELWNLSFTEALCQTLGPGLIWGLFPIYKSCNLD